MTVVSYPAGKPLDWDAIAQDPHRVSRMVMWSKRSKYNQVVRGSLFFICALDAMNAKAIKKFKNGVTVIQPAYNNTVEASKGTHDFDDCIDWEIPGLTVLESQHFARFECGMADWARTPAQGFPLHNHGFFLPPGGHVFPFKVGYFIDGGKSLGLSGYSSQIVDYWDNSYGLKDMHEQGEDHSPFPSAAAKMAGIFKLDDYIAKQREQNMEYTDWSAKSKQELAGDIADALVKRMLDTETVDMQQDKGKIKKITIRSAIRRSVNDHS